MWSFIPNFISKRPQSHPKIWHHGAIGNANSGWGVWAALCDNFKALAVLFREVSHANFLNQFPKRLDSTSLVPRK